MDSCLKIDSCIFPQLQTASPLQACMQTFEKGRANLSVFTKAGANLKKILILGPKLGV